jgi:hypothetical protein
MHDGLQAIRFQSRPDAAEMTLFHYLWSYRSKRREAPPYICSVGSARAPTQAIHRKRTFEDEPNYAITIASA